MMRAILRTCRRAVPLMLFVSAGCSEIDPFSNTPNNPPNTVFLDGPTDPTPQPDELITDPVVSLRVFGTDVIDGDAITAYHYQVTPGDGGWTRVRRSGVFTLTIGDLRDTTYTVCVRAEDTRGALDPDPTCRTFRVDVFRPGVIEPSVFFPRDGGYLFQWSLEGSEIPPEDLTWEYFFAEYCNRDRGGCVRDSLLQQSGWTVFPAFQRLEYFVGNPDTTHLYCLSLRAKDSLGRGPTPVRLCYPRDNH